MIKNYFLSNISKILSKCTIKPLIYINLKWETNQMNFKCISTVKKGAMRIWPDWWPKRPRICWMWNQQLPNYNVFYSIKK